MITSRTPEAKRSDGEAISDENRVVLPSALQPCSGKGSFGSETSSDEAVR